MGQSEAERAMWSAIREDMRGKQPESDGFIDPEHFSANTRAKINAYTDETIRAQLQPVMTSEQVYAAWQERLRGEPSPAFERMLDQLRYGLLVIESSEAGMLIKPDGHTP